ncbi:MAG: CoA ester lyase [Chloroflexi bacterium]|nr:CoA ester lyase [Chloroflexota bacterium]
MPVLFPRKSLLFAPASDSRKLAKAAQATADSIIIEMEDGVALNQKIDARANAVEALQTFDFGRRERMVRVNAVGTEFFEADARAVLAARPDTLVLPKADSPSEIRRAIALLDEFDPTGSIGLVAMIESPRAVLSLREICEAGRSRLNGLIFGAEDFAVLTGAVRTREAWEVFYARSAVVTAAAAFGLDAIDMVCNEIDDHERLKAECHIGRQLGFVGKQAIHPLQLEVIQRTFSPTDDELTLARRIIAAATAQNAAGAGAFALDGRMIDAPIVRQAERVMARGKSRA